MIIRVKIKLCAYNTINNIFIPHIDSTQMQIELLIVFDASANLGAAINFSS